MGYQTNKSFNRFNKKVHLRKADHGIVKVTWSRRLTNQHRLMNNPREMIFVNGSLDTHAKQTQTKIGMPWFWSILSGDLAHPIEMCLQ